MHPEITQDKRIIEIVDAIIFALMGRIAGLLYSIMVVAVEMGIWTLSNLFLFWFIGVDGRRSELRIRN